MNGNLDAHPFHNPFIRTNAKKEKEHCSKQLSARGYLVFVRRLADIPWRNRRESLDQCIDERTYFGG